MDREYFRNKLAKHKWLNEKPYTLQDYYFEAQPHLVSPLIEWMKAWGLWQREYIDTHGGTYGDLPEKPLPFLYVSGPRETAKTEILARGVGRYFMLNLGFANVRYIHWPTYINGLFAGKEEDWWGASFTILDGIDEEKPAQSNPSSWKLIQAITPLKTYTNPILIIGNHALHPQKKELSLGHYMGTTNDGRTTMELRDFSDALLSAIERNMYKEVYLNLLKPKSNGKVETKPEFHARLRKLAQEQDLQEIGFHFWLGEGGVEL